MRTEIQNAYTYKLTYTITILTHALLTKVEYGVPTVPTDVVWPPSPIEFKTAPITYNSNKKA